jgi:hypothetical protein
MVCILIIHVSKIDASHVDFNASMILESELFCCCSGSSRALAVTPDPLPTTLTHVFQPNQKN